MSSAPSLRSPRLVLLAVLLAAGAFLAAYAIAHSGVSASKSRGIGIVPLAHAPAAVSAPSLAVPPALPALHIPPPSRPAPSPGGGGTAPAPNSAPAPTPAPTPAPAPAPHGGGGGGGGGGVTIVG